MPSPFPGMDPFLEHPAIFPDLHDRFATELSTAINAVLPGKYYAGLASRVWVEESERYVEPDIHLLRAQIRAANRRIPAGSRCRTKSKARSSRF